MCDSLAAATWQLPLTWGKADCSGPQILESSRTFGVKPAGLHPRIRVETSRRGAIGQTGWIPLTSTFTTTDPDRHPSAVR